MPQVENGYRRHNSDISRLHLRHSQSVLYRLQYGIYIQEFRTGGSLHHRVRRRAIQSADPRLPVISRSTFYESQITMGHSRPRPKYLAKKLLQIRHTLRVSQGELVRQLGVQALIDHTTISKYELDKNEPPLTILLAYARLVGIPVEQIIDDELELTISLRF